MQNATTDPTTASATPTAPVAIPDDVVARVYQWGCGHARIRARGATEVEDELTDAATNAVLWTLRHCTDASTFENFAKAAIRRWVWRQVSRIQRKRANRPGPADVREDGTVDDLHARRAKPVRPELIDGLPDDLAFTVRLFFVDGYTLRDIALLTGVAPNTVDERLKRAAVLLHDGPVVDRPSRRNGEKRLCAG